VAKHLGVPPATLATRLASARRTLAKRLSKRGVALSGGALAGVLCSHAGALGRVAPAGRRCGAGGGGGGRWETVAALVSAQAVQLSEGVMRIMFVTKLKTVAVAVLTAFGLTTGIGLGLTPARAGDDTPAAANRSRPRARATRHT